MTSNPPRLKTSVTRRKPRIKKEHIIFFAIPFDSATNNLYERVRKAIKKRYPKVTTVIGTNQVGPSPSYSDVATFKAQNTELNQQFVNQIRAADIVVADLTHNNPNVHVELGIALSHNKNILRVTGRQTKELGFDIQNLEVYAYKDETELKERILHYLYTFFKIKRLRISPRYPSLYSENLSQINLRAPERHIDFSPDALPNALLKDGRIEIEFEIIQTYGNDNWFGVYIRVDAQNPVFGSHLVHVRPDGSLWVVGYPGQFPVADEPGTVSISGRKTLTIEFENNYLDARIGKTRLTTNRLSHQTIGRVWLATYSADAIVYSIKMICRDTIDLNQWNSP